MNNSQISLEIEEVIDVTPAYRKRETELLEIIEAIERISVSQYWKVLEDKVFNGVLDSLQGRIKKEKNPTEIYRLQGQIEWAEKYSDLSKISQAYMNELTRLRNQLNAKSN